ncbi:beta-xylanase [Leifsonia sp. LS1]|uniref:endo-1,4-beta-xylanase n=1 Tax=Leifsonia sp. LS1 TaxID=2828483 RepID=UPI001CFCC7F3|nr:endo-1,4-beta-xylanase [Leifsonia sp. LS1]GIT80436.1 beta-xylanase [Leifsonia sp. LS1]
MKRPPKRRAFALAAAVAAALVSSTLSLPAQAATVEEAPTTVLFSNFEQGRIAPWSAYGSGVAVAAYNAVRLSHETSLRVTGRTASSHGVGTPIGTLLRAGERYTASVWARLDAGASPSRMRIDVVEDGGAVVPVATAQTVTADGWTRLSGDYIRAGAVTGGTLVIAAEDPTVTFLLDDPLITAYRAGGTVIDGTAPLKDALPFPIGAATYQRFTTGQPGDVLTRHFNQVTPENYMKPEAWYTADKSFVAANPEADALMDWARRTDGRVYGHVLVWHSQVPAWFFRTDAGVALTSSADDQQILRERMRAHIYGVAGYFADKYGPFGSAGNPLTAFDVVNEVIADSAATASNGMRTSNWYNILGETFVDDAFRFADEAFNDVYADPAATRPVKLFINEYGTEGGDGASTKLRRYHDLVERLLQRGVPVDGVGHQFHVSLSTPVANLDTALTAFETMPVVQAVTEFDVATGYPATERLLVRQGAFVKRAFDIFRQHDRVKDLYSVTVWGLADLGSWRYYEGAPLLFDDYYNAKWAYVGARGGEIPAEPKAMNVYGGDVALDHRATSSPVWAQLAPTALADGTSFALRWSADHLTVKVVSADRTPEAADGIDVTLDGRVYTYGRDGSGDVEGVRKETATGWEAVLRIPASALASGGTPKFNIVVTDGGAAHGWNPGGIDGDLALLDDLQSVDVLKAPSAPAIDGVVDELWEPANAVSTDKAVTGTGTATARVRTLWSGDGDTLFVLAEVADPVIDTSASAAHEKDSVELFVDLGNRKAGAYTSDDMQLRINAAGAESFGSGDAAAQAARVDSAVTVVGGGYVVEAAIALLGKGGPGATIGFEAQVNDANGGRRVGVRNWADSSGASWNNTTRWGVARLVEQTETADAAIVPAAPSVEAGSTVDVTVSGFTTGDVVDVWLEPAPAPGERASVAAAAAIAGPTANSGGLLGSVAIGDDGSGAATLTVPQATLAGDYLLEARLGDTTAATASLAVVAPAAGGVPGAVGTDTAATASGDLAATGSTSAAGYAVAALVGLALLVAGGIVLRRRRAI